MKRLLLLLLLFVSCSIGMNAQITFSSLTEVSDGNVDTSAQIVLVNPSTNIPVWRGSVGELLKAISRVGEVIATGSIVDGTITDADIASGAGIGIEKLDTSSVDAVVSKSRLSNALDDVGGGSGGDGTINTISEKKRYYHEEIITDQQISTTTGAISANTGTNISGFIEIEADSSITIRTRDSSLVTIYGWTYDASRTAISEIRPSASIGTQVSTYTFTAPATAAYIQIYTKYASEDFHRIIEIESTNEISYSTPIRPENYSGANDAAKINNAIEFARWVSAPVVLTGLYEIDEAIIIHSNTTLLLDDAKIKGSVGLRDNLIRNAAVADPSNIFDQGNRDIRILGTGMAILEGADETWGSDNPDGFASQRWRSIGILLANVSKFRIDGLTINSTSAWGICMEQSYLGSVKNIVFNQDGRTANQDGINIRRGSHRINVENIVGTTFDDMVALTNLLIAPNINILGTSTNYMPYRTNFDIYDVTVKNIQRDSLPNFAGFPAVRRGGILLLCEDNLKIHDVTIDGVTGVQQINVGFSDIDYSVTDTATVDDMYNINISNTNQSPVYLNRPVKNSAFWNIPRTDITGTYASGVFRSGSLKSLRRYYDGNWEYYDNGFVTAVNTDSIDYRGIVFAGVTNNLKTDTASLYWDETNGVLFANNDNPNGYAGIVTENDQGINVQAFLRTYGSTFALDSLKNRSAFGSNVDINIFTDGNIPNGGDGFVSIYAGGYNADQERVRINSTGMSVQTGTNATAYVDIAASTAATPSLKIAEGAAVIPAQDGAIEHFADNLYFTAGTTKYPIPKTRTATATLDFTSTAAGTSTDLTITVGGASDGDVVNLGVPNGSVNANSCFTAWVSATDTVTVRFNNYSSGAIDPSSGSFKVSVIKF